MDLMDLPAAVIRELRTADAEHRRKIFNFCLRGLALAQRDMGVRRIYLTLEANNDVTVATVLDRQGKSESAYAWIARGTGDMTLLGKELQPPSRSADDE